MSNIVPSDTHTDSHTVRDRVSTNLKQAKAEGSLRAERIREIVQTAVAQAIVEVKEGSQEVRPVVKDALAAVLEVVSGKGKEVQQELSAAVEGLIEGLSHSRRTTLAETESQVQQLQVQADHQSQLLESEVDQALTEIQTTGKTSSDLDHLIEAAVKAVKEKEEFAMLRQQYARLRAQLEAIEARLEAKYGDRYDEAKRHLENAKTWYDSTRAEAEARGIDPITKKQGDLESKMAEAGTAIARREQQVKQLLREFLHSVNNKRSS